MKLYKHNSKIKILSKEFVVRFEKNKMLRPRVLVLGSEIKVFSGELNKASQSIILRNWLIEYAREFIEKRVDFYATKNNFSFNKISIKEQSSRWGSCSSKKNLNFNWKLILTSRPCLDYVVVHELCHLREMNHSKNFWNLVENIMPDYEIHRRSLRLFEKELAR
ncbi:MAG: hypothetical protein Kow0081_4990 [Candidatus Dojkabacteria bacterium]